MKPSSKYAELKHVVETCEPGKSHYEPIAAFNVAPVAIGYAEYCARTSPLYRYRVMQRTTGENFVQIHPAPANTMTGKDARTTVVDEAHHVRKD